MLGLEKDTRLMVTGALLGVLGAVSANYVWQEMTAPSLEIQYGFSMVQWQMKTVGDEFQERLSIADAKERCVVADLVMRAPSTFSAPLPDRYRHVTRLLLVNRSRVPLTDVMLGITKPPLQPVRITVTPPQGTDTAVVSTVGSDTFFVLPIRRILPEATAVVTIELDLDSAAMDRGEHSPEPTSKISFLGANEIADRDRVKLYQIGAYEAALGEARSVGLDGLHVEFRMDLRDGDTATISPTQLKGLQWIPGITCTHDTSKPDSVRLHYAFTIAGRKQVVTLKVNNPGGEERAAGRLAPGDYVRVGPAPSGANAGP